MSIRLLTPAQIAELLGVSQKTIYKWSHHGTIPVVRAGRLLRFDESDVMNYFKRDKQRMRKTQPKKVESSKMPPLKMRRATAEVDSLIKTVISEVLD